MGLFKTIDIDEVEYVKLVKRIFSTDDGKKLLNIWHKDLLESKTHNSNPYDVYFQKGKEDMIKEIICDVYGQMNNFKEVSLTDDFTLDNLEEK